MLRRRGADATPRDCRDCAFFVATVGLPAEYGRCRLFDVRDPVDGTTRPDLVARVRPLTCRGDLFAPRDPPALKARSP
jgi:hypothetical protein